MNVIFQEAREHFIANLNFFLFKLNSSHPNRNEVSNDWKPVIRVDIANWNKVEIVNTYKTKTNEQMAALTKEKVSLKQ